MSLLIHFLEDEGVKHVWLADSATAGTELSPLNTVGLHCTVDLGLDYRHHPNASTAWLISSESKLKEASIMIIPRNKGAHHCGRERHLGAALGVPVMWKVVCSRR